MTPQIIGWRLARVRRRAGLRQSEVAARMGTTQSAVSRLESGRSVPSVELITRYARAVGEPISLTFGEPDTPTDRSIRQERVRAALAGYRFDPWEREPTSAEARTLIADGVARIIRVDDLYLDRLRQATMQEDHEGIEFHSALAVAAACFDRIDWCYVESRIAALSGEEATIGQAMRRLDSLLRRRVRRVVDE